MESEKTIMPIVVEEPELWLLDCQPECGNSVRAFGYRPVLGPSPHYLRGLRYCLGVYNIGPLSWLPTLQHIPKPWRWHQR